MFDLMSSLPLFLTAIQQRRYIALALRGRFARRVAVTAAIGGGNV